MRPLSVLILLLLAACSGGGQHLSGETPGLDVADAALGNGAPVTALQIAERMLAKNPMSVAALLRAGEAQAQLGKRYEAEHDFQKALALDPDNISAELGLGRLRLATDPAAAATLFERAAGRDPANLAALTDLGVARDLLGQHSAAQREYRRALSVDPQNIGASVNLGLSLALSGNAQQALEILRPLARDVGTSKRVRQDLAVALALSGDNQAAAQILRDDMRPADVPKTIAAYHLLYSQRE